ncbi:MAG: glycosylase [Clostridia bacterium]|nr:glycosylase [Clostridia bacterium]
MNRPDWLKDAVFYEIYPSSFYDGNGDGIGDVNGIRQKLPYVKELGCNALWLNPCFDSPFKDGGYDVRDYKKVAPRYGTNEDLYALFREAHELGIRVLLDLVPGHTSEEHPWFLESGKAERNEYSDRYVWTDFWIKGTPGHPYIGGETPRNGTYMLNFFKCQPALNYGWAKVTEPWQTPADAPAAKATRNAMADVMRFWLEKGCDGFRVDMANSLIKGDDDDKSYTCALWKGLLGELRAEFPESAYVAEWGWPRQALNLADFDMDFYLDHKGNGYNRLVRSADAYLKGNDPLSFVRDYLDRYEISRELGYISFITGNHDTPRISWYLTEGQLKVGYALLFTLPGVPFLYYGDEIGMRYLSTLPTKEGGYTRTGSRTPMQWAKGRNLGFSEAASDALYLPVDPAPDAPTAEEQAQDPDSLLNTVKAILALRHRFPELQADGSLEVVHARKDDPLLVYKRGTLTLALNPSNKAVKTELTSKPLFQIGTYEKGVLGACSFVVID